MIKNIALAAVAVLGVAGVSAPAFADSSLTSQTSISAAFDSTTILARLQSQGVPATSVEEWGDYVRAFVPGANGGEVMQFFTTDSLTPVQL